jgi:hypothetical protein
MEQPSLFDRVIPMSSRSRVRGPAWQVNGNEITRLKIFDLTEGRGDAAFLVLRRDVY